MVARMWGGADRFVPIVIILAGVLSGCRVQVIDPVSSNSLKQLTAELDKVFVCKGDQATLTVSGAGSSSLQFSVVSGGGSISSLGVFDATVAGSIRLSVQDGQSTAYADVVVHNDLQLSLSQVPPVPKNSAVQVLPTGCKGPYTFEKIQGAGTLDTATGTYTTRALLGETAQIRVTDALGHQASINIDSAKECPANFVKVAANATQGTPEFCISSLEMTTDGSGKAVISPLADGYTARYSRSFNMAVAACAAQGWRLPTINESDAVADDLSSVDLNWSGAAVGVGSVIGSGWNVPLTLSSGETIYDFSSGLREMADVGGAASIQGAAFDDANMYANFPGLGPDYTATWLGFRCIANYQ